MVKTSWIPEGFFSFLALKGFLALRKFEIHKGIERKKRR